MIATVARLDRVSELLDEIIILPLGHPDRLRLLTCAEQVFEESPTGTVREQETQDTRSVLSEAHA